MDLGIADRKLSKGVVTGVVGNPIRHSRSPRIHNFWIKQHNIESIYVPFDVDSRNINGFLRSLGTLGIKGLNVTTPHKEDAFAVADVVTDRARSIGAVNTLAVLDDGALYGDSTDGWGFLASLRAAVGWSSPGKKMLLLGAGGASSAIVQALAGDGVEQIFVANRTEERARVLAQRFGDIVEVRSWPCDRAVFESADLIVNATTLGMYHQGDDGIWEQTLADVALDADTIVTDLIYAPLQTPFLKAAARRGARTVDGLGMLMHQARPGFELWHGVAPEVDARVRAEAETETGYLP